VADRRRGCGARSSGCFLSPFRRALETPEASKASRANAASRHTIPRLAAQIYDKRPDLQTFFPDPGGRDRVKYLVWLLSYGKREYLLPEEHVSMLRDQWLDVLGALSGFRTRLKYRMLLRSAAMCASAGPFISGLLRHHVWQRVLRMEE
jgi:hypothetical protein